MFIVGLLSWWYGTGWRQRSQIVRGRLASTIDYFSIDLLLKTFFSPFRQISAGKVSGSLGVQWRAFVDRLISRCIGAIVRFILIIIGSVVILFWGAIGLVSLALWAVIPLLPIVGLGAMFIGWTPAWM